MKKVVGKMILSLLAVSVIAGCGGASTPSSQQSSSPASEQSAQTSEQAAEPAKQSGYPEKPIKLIVSFAAGGGTDLGARLLTPYLEKELGVPVVVENKPGGGGWVGYSELLKSKPDGYTIGYVNTPGLITGYLNPTANRKENLDSFEFIINHVIDPGVVAVRADDNRFATINDLVEYAKQNELTATTNGAGSGNHLAILQMNRDLGTKFKPVHTGGTSEALTAVLGGHVDVLIAKVGEVLEPQKEGQIKVLGVAVSERVSQLPDVPTLKEAFGIDLENYSIRGIAGPKGMDPEHVAILQEAFEKAMNNPEHIEKMKEMGLNIDTTKGEEFKKLLQKEEETTKGLKDLLGW